MKSLLIAPAVLLAVAASAHAATPTVTPARSVNISERDAGTRTAKIAILLSRRATRRASVRFRTVPGTASAADFRSRRGVLRLRRGARKASIRIRIKGDALDESNETFTLRLSAPRKARLGRRRTARVTIVDDDPPPSISIASQAATEPGAPGALLPHRLTARLSEPANRTVTVGYAFSAAQATTTANDVDLAAGNLTFAPGETSKVIPGTVKGDALDENPERARLALANARGAVIATPEAYLTIVDDPADLPPVVSIGDATTNERPGGGLAQPQLTLSAPSGRVVSVAYATQDDTAVSSGPAPDYMPGSGTVVLQPGQTARTVSVATLDDPRDEPQQDFKVLLSQPEGAALGDTEGLAHIVDDDPMPSISINDVSRIETNSVAQFTVTVSQVSEHVITFQANTVENTAIGANVCAGNADYVQLANLAVTVNPGQPSAGVSVFVCHDTTDEPNEAANVILSNAVNATIADGTGLLTILDND